MGADTATKRLSAMNMALPWRGLGATPGGGDYPAIRSAGIHLYAYVRQVGLKRGITPHISPPIPTLAPKPAVVPAPRRGIRPFRSNIKDIKEARQALQHLSARLGEAEASALWHIVGPIRGPYAASYGEMVLMDNATNSGQPVTVTLPKIKEGDMGKRICCKLWAEGTGGENVVTTGNDEIDSGWDVFPRNVHYWPMGGHNGVRAHEAVTFIAGIPSQWHVMSGFWDYGGE